MKNDSWANLLNPDILKANLIKSSMYITAFELLKENIIDHPKTFYTDGFDSDGLIINKNYKTKVLSRNKSPLYASLDWFKEMDTISEDDIEIFTHLKNYRNKLSHEMANSIFKGIDEEEYYQLFTNLISLFEKIDKWWILNFEMAINPDINFNSVDENLVMSGPVIMLRVMLDIVFSDNDESWKYYKDYIRQFGDR